MPLRRPKVICSLEKSFTPAERSMAEIGEHQRLRETRLFFQHARETDFRQTVEQLTGRRVRGFLNGTDTHASTPDAKACHPHVTTPDAG
jgi:uncharacterized protein YbcI